MARLLTFLAAFMAVIVTVREAHSPERLLEGAYQLQFENDLVRVERVRYAPYARLPVHAHPRVPTVYVYLTDGDEVTFRHRADDGRLMAVGRRPKTRARSFRLDRGFAEQHEVLNPSPRPSEFLRVMFHAERPSSTWQPLRFPAPEPGATGSGKHLEFENDHVRIWRLAIAPGRRLDLAASSDSLIVALTPARLTILPHSNSPAESRLALGETAWVSGDDAAWLATTGRGEAAALRLEFPGS